MDNNQTIRKWSDLYKMNVTIPSEGKTLGQVEDFFFKEDSNAIYALCVHTRLHGDLALPVTYIQSVEKDHVAIRNEQALTRALPSLTRGQQLLSRNVVDSKQNDGIGTIKDVYIAVEPPTTMRIGGYDVLHGSSNRTLGADGVAHYNNEDNSIVVYDQTAKKLR